MIEYRDQHDGDDRPGQQLLGKVVQINFPESFQRPVSVRELHPFSHDLQFT
jgi:hypothetical protein